MFSTIRLHDFKDLYPLHVCKFLPVMFQLLLFDKTFLAIKKISNIYILKCPTLSEFVLAVFFLSPYDNMSQFTYLT